MSRVKLRIYPKRAIYCYRSKSEVPTFAVVDERWAVGVKLPVFRNVDNVAYYNVQSVFSYGNVLLPILPCMTDTRIANRLCASCLHQRPILILSYCILYRFLVGSFYVLRFLYNLSRSCLVKFSRSVRVKLIFSQ